jgi:hypothetical protein
MRALGKGLVAEEDLPVQMPRPEVRVVFLLGAHERRVAPDRGRPVAGRCHLAAEHEAVKLVYRKPWRRGFQPEVRATA